MNHIDKAAQLIESIKRTANAGEMSAWEIAHIHIGNGNVQPAKIVNEILSRVDSLDGVAFENGKSAWFVDINENRHRVISGNFGTFHVETERYEPGYGTWQAGRFSAPLRTQGAAASVLARRLTIRLED